MEVVNLENSEHYTWGGNSDGWHLLNSSGLSVIQERVPPGRSEVTHYHENAHQFFFVLSGEATVEIEDKKFVLYPQQGISVPPKLPHHVKNEGVHVLTFLVISAPRSHGDRVLVG
jgi:mannose-6-phosphate isomerase-like protein (cupin superfamily)